MQCVDRDEYLCISGLHICTAMEFSCSALPSIYYGREEVLGGCETNNDVDIALRSGSLSISLEGASKDE